MTEPIGLKDDDDALGKLQSALDEWSPWKGPAAGASAPPVVKAPEGPALNLVREQGAPPPSDSELAELQAFARRRRQSAALGQAASNFADALTPASRRPVSSESFWKGYGEEGDREIADYGARKAEAEKKAAAAKTASNAAGVASWLKSNYPNINWGSMTDEQIAASIPLSTLAIKEQGDLNQANAQAKARAQLEADKGAAKAKELENLRGTLWQISGPALQKRGITREALASMGEESIQALQRDMDREARGDQGFAGQAYGAYLSEQNRISAEKREAERKAAEAAARAAGEAKELEAPGWVRNADSPGIKREEAAGFREGIASHRALTKSADKMTGMIKTYGSELFGPKRGVMANLNREMLLEVKNLAKLGVLSKSDEDIINDLIPNPTGAAGATTSTATMIAQMGAFKELLDRKLNARAYSLGYQKPGAPEGNGPSPETPDIPRSLKMKFPDGSVQEVAPADIQMARRKGGVEAD